MTLFVDTSAWYAAADRRDRANGRAKRILAQDPDLVTSDHVLVETWSLIRHRLGRQPAEHWWAAVRAGGAQLEPVGMRDLETAWGISRAFEDQDFSIVDRTSFAIMERLGLLRVVSFDADFAVYRYGLHGDRAFTVLR